MSAPGLFLIAAAAIVLLLLLVEGIARMGGGAFITTVVLGQDGRTSTSKTFILLWTLLVGWALISLLIAGELIGRHACTVGSSASAIAACKSEHDEIGLLQLGWLHFLEVGLVGSYIVLLAIPSVSGVAAKGITQSKVASGAIEKPRFSAGGGKRGLGVRVAQVFSADDKTTDIGDFQYMIFNLILAVYFVSNFVKPSGSGLPTIPDTLLGLTSASAALYVGKKAVATSDELFTPSVTAIFPGTLRAGASFTILGTGLHDPSNPPPPGRAAQIEVNGLEATNVQVDPVIPNRLTARAPANLLPPGQSEITATLKVATPYGAITPGFTVQCAR